MRRIRPRTLLIVLTAAAVMGSSAPARADTGLPPTMQTRISGFSGRVGFSGGWVQRNPIVRLIFWGPKWRRTDPVARAEIALFRELAGSQYNGLLGQYGVRNDLRLRGVFFDRTTPPFRHPLTLARMAHEAARVARKRRWRIDFNRWCPDGHRGEQEACSYDQWVILPQPGTDMRRFTADECAEHDLQYVGNQPYVLLVIPPLQDPEYASGCLSAVSTADSITTTPQPLVDATTSATSHEYAEAATDPDGSTGWGNSNAEIADPCGYTGIPAGMTVAVSYIWSDSLGAPDGCTL